MEILIERKDLSYLIPQQKFVWNIYLKQRSRLLIAFSIAAFLLLLDAWDNYSKTDNYLTVTFSIGLSLAIYTLLNLGILLFRRAKSFEATKKICKASLQGRDSSTVTIIDWGIKIKAYDYYMEFPWCYFYSHRVEKDCLILDPIHPSLTLVIISKSEVSSSDYSNLLSFVAQKMSKKKNGI